MNSAIEERATSVVEYSATEAGLAELRERLKDRVYDVATTKGLTEAKADRAELRGLRVNLDKLRKQLNEDDQARIKLRNGKASELTLQIAALEDPIDEQIKAEEDRKEAEREARRLADQERIAGMTAAIADLANAPLRGIGMNQDELRALLAELPEPGAEFDELYLPTAVATRQRAVDALQAMLAERQRLDEQAAQLAAQAAEQEARQAEADRIHAEAEQARQEAQAAEDAERAERQAEEDRQRAAQLDADRVAREAVEAQQAERQAELDRQEAAAQAQRDADAAQAALDRENAREQELQAERRREAEERQRATLAQAQADQAAIDAATIWSAAVEALKLLTELAPDHLTTKKLAAVIALGH